jgi:hypothetical protein
MKPGNRTATPVAERRKRPRAALHCALLITRSAHGQPLETTTVNVSSEGFYCLLSEAVTAGERVECTIRIPARSQDRSDVWLCLQCRAQVLRVDQYGVPGMVGVAFHIEDYTIARLTPDRLPRA